MSKIFIVYGHYSDQSFNAAIRDTFIETAKQQGHSIDCVDLYNIEVQFEIVTGILEEANIPVDGLFLNADAGFDSKEFRLCCEKKEINANICFNKRNGNVDRDEYFDGSVLDEIGDQNPKIWNEILRPSLADRKGFCLFIGTPKGNNHFKDLFDRAGKEEGWAALQFKASETKLLDEQELLSARKEND